MTPKQILSIFKNFAVIGVTEDQDKYGYRIYKKLKDCGYHTFGISHKYNEVDGDIMYKSLEDIPSPIDVVVFVVNPKYSQNYTGQMRSIGIRYAWMQPRTYNEKTLEAMKELGITPIIDCVLRQLDKKDQI